MPMFDVLVAGTMAVIPAVVEYNTMGKFVLHTLAAGTLGALPE